MLSGHEGPESLVPWDQELLQAVTEECRVLLDYRTRRDIERRARAGTGTENKGQVGCKSHNHDEAHGHSHECYKFQKDDKDDIGAVLDKWVTDAYVKEIAPIACENAFLVFNRVVRRGLQEGATLLEEESKQLRQQTLKESLTRQIVLRVSDEARRGHVMDGIEGGLVANPSGYREGPLEFLQHETIAALMTTGFATQPAYIGESMRRQVLQDIEWLDFDGRLNDMSGVSGGAEPFRSDHMCWISPNEIDREQQAGLTHLMGRMMTLPFELNKKANLYLQSAYSFQVAMYPESGSYYKKHFDSGFDSARDNGRKITAIYYPNPANWAKDHGGYMRLFPRQTKSDQERQERDKNETPSHLADIKPGPDMLLLFRSRDMPHEVLPCSRKRFAVTLWMAGPAGPGDN